ncbi:2Fe-2S iron-sulfur cluster-binding protein [Ramlibacter sp. PS4R-6]|uniref:2Fe-2S iron-sulfur cluster-binding protein n=1 Tax=Ramlibacter sp. PS4R-6 TaxID=3133438 RepID=UPI0030A86D6A
MAKVTIHLVAANGNETTLECALGQSLMQAAIASNVEGIDAECGGTMTCATCHVYVREGFLPKLPIMTSDEDSMLDFTASLRKANSRLSCQIPLTEELDGLTVDLPETQT